MTERHRGSGVMVEDAFATNCSMIITTLLQLYKHLITASQRRTCLVKIETGYHIGDGYFLPLP